MGRITCLATQLALEWALGAAESEVSGTASRALSPSSWDADCLVDSFLVFEHLVRLTSMEAPGHPVHL